ncbi:hypothetical protein BU692_10230 [Staphylococcus chromogenes]|uniref:hypothetical protein n=1 Tax=Staphylococcus chromogenes TaxID=46126 RepID=UPI000D1B189E|nr:hypothetical protein [Staphylococcus chromogenes]PTG54703.1 hypothetical protein BU692_10230 [Staphylococcus chromogenes]
MSKLKAIKIALLIVILAEEIRNARNYKKVIGKPFKVKLDVDTPQKINTLREIRKNQIDFLKTL